jgi:hypothetical protein
MNKKTIEIKTETRSLDGDVVAEKIKVFFAGLEENPLKIYKLLENLYLEGVAEGLLMAGLKVKGITKRAKEEDHD